MEADLVELRSSKPSVTSDYLSAVDPDIRFAHALALDILAPQPLRGATQSIYGGVVVFGVNDKQAATSTLICHPSS
jgi:hypothetical protein